MSQEYVPEDVRLCFVRSPTSAPPCGTIYCDVRLEDLQVMDRRIPYDDRDEDRDSGRKGVLRLAAHHSIPRPRAMTFLRLTAHPQPKVPLASLESFHPFASLVDLEAYCGTEVIGESGSMHPLTRSTSTDLTLDRHFDAPRVIQAFTHL